MAQTLALTEILKDCSEEDVPVLVKNLREIETFVRYSLQHGATLKSPEVKEATRVYADIQDRYRQIDPTCNALLN